MYVNVARLTEWHLLHDRLAFFRDHPQTATKIEDNILTRARELRIAALNTSS